MGETLILAAAPAEARAVAAAFDAPAPDSDCDQAPARVAPGVELILTGVGKVNAALALASVLDPSRHRAVLCVGVCGALPHPDGRPGLTLAQTVLADVSVYADEGIAAPGGWQSIAAAGFPPGRLSASGGMGVPADPSLLKAARARLGPAAAIGPVATVSTCSGTDALAHDIVLRTGALAEAMEGAAVGHALLRLCGRAATPAFLELRTVSNTTGDRDRQRWDLPAALSALTRSIRALTRPSG